MSADHRFGPLLATQIVGRDTTQDDVCVWEVSLAYTATTVGYIYTRPRKNGQRVGNWCVAWPTGPQHGTEIPAASQENAARELAAIVGVRL